ncbi:restriction endonuclease subunit S [Bradyrhizobium sp. USDA 4353]
MAEWRTETVEDCLVRLPLAAVPKLQTRDYRPSGRHPIIDQGQSLIAGWTDDESGLIAHNLPVVVFGDHTRAFKFVDFPFVRGADGTQILKPKPDIDPLFFYYALRAIDLPSRGYNRHFKALKEKEISVPTKPEQNDIGRVLKAVEGSLNLQDEELAAWDRCKRAAMRTLFTRGLRDEPQKETEIGLVPESWDVVDFASIRDRLQYGTSTRCTYEPDGLPVLRIPNIEPGRVNASDLKFGRLPAEEANRYKLQDGDLIFIRTNGVLDRLGSCAVYSGAPENALFASYLIRAQLNREKVDPYFAAFFYGSEAGTGIVAGRATPAADGKYNLNTGTIDSLPLPLPAILDEQREIVAILDAIDRKIDLHKKKRAVLEELFKSLLHKLTTDEIRVGDLDLSALDLSRVAEVAA